MYMLDISTAFTLF